MVLAMTRWIWYVRCTYSLICNHFAYCLACCMAWRFIIVVQHQQMSLFSWHSSCKSHVFSCFLFSFSSKQACDKYLLFLWHWYTYLYFLLALLFMKLDAYGWKMIEIVEQIQHGTQRPGDSYRWTHGANNDPERQSDAYPPVRSWCLLAWFILQHNC